MLPKESKQPAQSSLSRDSFSRFYNQARASDIKLKDDALAKYADCMKIFEDDPAQNSEYYFEAEGYLDIAHKAHQRLKMYDLEEQRIFNSPLSLSRPASHGTRNSQLNRPVSCTNPSLQTSDSFLNSSFASSCTAGGTATAITGNSRHILLQAEQQRHLRQVLLQPQLHKGCQPRHAAQTAAPATPKLAAAAFASVQPHYADRGVCSIAISPAQNQPADTSDGTSAHHKHSLALEPSSIFSNAAAKQTAAAGCSSSSSDILRSGLCPSANEIQPCVEALSRQRFIPPAKPIASTTATSSAEPTRFSTVAAAGQHISSSNIDVLSAEPHNSSIVAGFNGTHSSAATSSRSSDADSMLPSGTAVLVSTVAAAAARWELLQQQELRTELHTTEMGRLRSVPLTLLQQLGLARKPPVNQQECTQDGPTYVGQAALLKPDTAQERFTSKADEIKRANKQRRKLKKLLGDPHHLRAGSSMSQQNLEYINTFNDWLQLRKWLLHIWETAHRKRGEYCEQLRDAVKALKAFAGVKELLVPDGKALARRMQRYFKLTGYAVSLGLQQALVALRIQYADDLTREVEDEDGHLGLSDLVYAGILDHSDAELEQPLAIAAKLVSARAADYKWQRKLWEYECPWRKFQYLEPEATALWSTEALTALASPSGAADGQRLYEENEEVLRLMQQPGAKLFTYKQLEVALTIAKGEHVTLPMLLQQEAKSIADLRKMPNKRHGGCMPVGQDEYHWYQQRMLNAQLQTLKRGEVELGCFVSTANSVSSNLTASSAAAAQQTSATEQQRLELKDAVAAMQLEMCKHTAIQHSTCADQDFTTMRRACLAHHSSGGRAPQQAEIERKQQQQQQQRWYSRLLEHIKEALGVNNITDTAAAFKPAEEGCSQPQQQHWHSLLESVKGALGITVKLTLNDDDAEAAVAEYWEDGCTAEAAEEPSEVNLAMPAALAATGGGPLQLATATSARTSNNIARPKSVSFATAAVVATKKSEAVTYTASALRNSSTTSLRQVSNQSASRMHSPSRLGHSTAHTDKADNCNNSSSLTAALDVDAVSTSRAGSFNCDSRLDSSSTAVSAAAMGSSRYVQNRALSCSAAAAAAVVKQAPSRPGSFIASKQLQEMQAALASGSCAKQVSITSAVRTASVTSKAGDTSSMRHTAAAEEEFSGGFVSPSSYRKSVAVEVECSAASDADMQYDDLVEA